MNNILDDNNKTVGLLERILQLIKTYNLWDFCKTFVMIFLVSIMTICITRPEKVFEYFEKAKEKQHIILMEHRANQTLKIQHTLDKLLYKSNASRVELIELHNGAVGNGGLPFLKGTVTYECLNDTALPVSSQYKDVSLSLIPFASHLSNVGFWCGNTEDMMEIDRSLSYRLLSNNTSHFAAIKITNGTKIIGFLFVSFDGLKEGHNCQYIKELITTASLELGVLLTVNK